MIEWTPSLATGVPVLDGQHQELFKRIAEIQDAVHEHRTLFGVYALTRLKHFVKDHFTEEERLMREAAYPNLEEHIIEHDAFRIRLSQLLVKSIGRDMPPELIAFLQNWLTHHIAVTDMEYVPYLKAKGLA